MGRGFRMSRFWEGVGADLLVWWLDSLGRVQRTRDYIARPIGRESHTFDRWFTRVFENWGFMYNDEV